MIAIFTATQITQLKYTKIPSGVTIGDPCTSTDGRYAVYYDFSNSDVAYLSGAGVQVLADTPADFILIGDDPQ